MKKIFLFLTIVINLNLYSQEGVLDPIFGVNGIVNIGFGVFGSYDIGTCMDIQSDGKIVVAGYSEDKIALARLNTDGTLDNTFGSGGKIITYVYSGGSIPADIQIQNDGKIIVVGYTYDNNGDSYFVVLRYNSDGTIDNTFSDDGKFIGDFGGSHNTAHSLAIQIDGKILVAGEASSTAIVSTVQMAVLRLNTNGTLDNNFGTSGKVLINFSNSSSSISSIAIKTVNLFNQKIILAGNVDPTSGSRDFALVQLTLSGTLDNSFGAGGIVTTAISSDHDAITGLKIQSDGKILVVGSTDFFKIALARYNEDGSLDNTFSGDGKVVTTLSENVRISDVVIQSNNKIIVIGNYFIGYQSDILLVRYSSSGALDYSFGTNGYLTTSISDTTDDGVSAKFQSDGKLVVAGYSFDGFGYGDFVVLRYIISSNLVSVGEETELPTEFRLEQNYPNPFNPTTKIKFRVPNVILRQAQDDNDVTLSLSESDQMITLKVYDILGNEVATLVDEYKEAGTYEVEFNAIKLSSGTYFYRLTAGDFTETKKMILLK
ncbi:MAG: T9SS type A sorting domain-containing protein [Ignavibacteriaceae bacterium]|nr:T9SS type A sorting domain-containing protein [Ignavibacteriaceae bacterium]